MSSSENQESSDPQSGPSATSETPPFSTTKGQDHQQQQHGNPLLRTAMQLADVIRKHEEEQRSGTLNNTQQESAPPSDNTGLWQNATDFLETPGVKEGCIAAGLCVGAFLPIRKVLLRIADQRLNLGTVFPDLIVTPPLVIMTFQLPLFVGTLYGSQYYMQRLANIPAEAPSATADAICNDPVTVAAIQNTTHLQAFNEYHLSWDPRQQTVNAMQKALHRCRARREHQLQQLQQLEETPSASSKEQISWWRK